MTDAIRELFELLAKKENTGSDYTGTITRVEGNTAYVRFNGSDITDTPVALSIGASEGDTVRVRVADGRAWLVGNDTAPPNDSSGVAYDLIRTNAYIRQLTTERIYGENGWINLLTGTFDYGNGALSWNGDHLTVKGAITATSGQIGPWNITSSAIYKVSSTWGSSTAGAAYFGNSGVSITDKFKVDANGALTATGATISGTLTAGKNSKIGPWTVTANSIYYGNSAYGNANGLYFGTSGLSLTDKFKVSSAGVLTATGATISGTITVGSGSIGGFTVSNSANTGTTANGGHCYTKSFYFQASNDTYEYEVGMKGSSGTGTLAFYVGRITKGAQWSTNTKVFSITNAGNLTATAGTIGPWTLSSSGFSNTTGTATTQIYPSYIYLSSSSGGVSCNISSSDIGLQNTSGTMTIMPTGINSVASVTTGTQFSVTCNATGGRSGRLLANATNGNGNFGLHDVGNNEWVLRSGSDGNVYIPHKLYCYGTEDATGRIPILSNTDSAGLVSTMSADSARLRVRGRWGGTTFSAHDFTWSGSDIRLKTDINKSKVNALDLIRQIDICEFKMQDVYHPVGMVADWIEELDPLLTSGGGYEEDGAPHYKSVDTFYLMGYVVKAIQELADKVSKFGG